MLSSSLFSRFLIAVFLVSCSRNLPSCHGFGVAARLAGVVLSDGSDRAPLTAPTQQQRNTNRLSSLTSSSLSSSSCLSMTAVASEEHRRMGELTHKEEQVFQVMQSLHDAKYPFRIVVVGHGAILETTSTLGPSLAISQSPRTGKNLLTLASTDKSFEFHLALADVTQMQLLEKVTPMKTMRMIRVMGRDDNDNAADADAHGHKDEKKDHHNAPQSMCSLILSDPSEAAIEWFQGLVQKYGETIDLA